MLSAADLARRFSASVGGTLDPGKLPNLMAMMTRILHDDRAMLGPIKHDVAKGGRERPYVRFPQQNVCDHVIDDRDHQLNTSGSYRSGHATYGWRWGLILSNTVSKRADPIMAKAFDFGKSRLVCGFHFSSDLLAGRLAASALFAQLEADPVFKDDLKRSRAEIRKALDLPASR